MSLDSLRVVMDKMSSTLSESEKQSPPVDESGNRVSASFVACSNGEDRISCALSQFDLYFIRSRDLHDCGESFLRLLFELLPRIPHGLFFPPPLQ